MKSVVSVKAKINVMSVESLTIQTITIIVKNAN